MIKVFTTNKEGKIELTKEELKNLLDEAYWDGHRAAGSWTYRTPNLTPYYWTGTGTSITLNTADGVVSSNEVPNGQMKMEINK